MIERKDWEEAYDILSYITSNVQVLEDGFRNGILQGVASSLSYYENKLQYISMGSSTSHLVQSNLKFNSLNVYSFVRSKEHRDNNVNIHLVYRPVNHIRLGHLVLTNFDFSEENIFQQSLVLDNIMVNDLEFIGFLRNKKFDKTVMFKRDAYSIEGLRMIKERVEEALCYLSEKK